MPVVAPIAGIMVALAVALLFWAIYSLFRPMITSLVSNIPLIGETLSQTVDGLITWAWQHIDIWARIGLTDLIALIATPLHWTATMLGDLTDGLADVLSVLSYLRYVVIPREIRAALSIAAGWVHDGENFALGLYHQATDYAASLVGSLQRWTQSALSSLASYALSLFHQAIDYATSAVTAAQQYALGLYHAAISFTQAGIAGAENYAQTLFTQAITYTGAQITDVENWVQARLSALQTWTGAEILSLSQAIALARADAFAFTRAQVATVEDELGRLKRDCTDNLCSNLGSLANMFGSLTSILDDAALVAIAADFAHDPGGAAHRMQAELGPFTEDMIGYLRDAAGV